MNALYVLGRMLFGGYFLYNGVNHFLRQDAMAGYAGSKNVPSPQLAVQGSGALLVLGGLSVLLDVKPQVGAALTAIFLLGVTPIMHRYWEAEEPAARQADQVNFLKNLGLLGAALMLTQVQNRVGDARVDGTMRALAVGE